MYEFGAAHHHGRSVLNKIGCAPRWGLPIHDVTIEREERLLGRINAVYRAITRELKAFHERLLRVASAGDRDKGETNRSFERSATRSRDSSGGDREIGGRGV